MPLNERNFLKWTSNAIQIENPIFTKSKCMKMAIGELKKEKQMRKFIQAKSLIYQKDYPGMSKAISIKRAMLEWKKV
tara:strand:+ start:818 stop:1048 length:231 start_codon:yes stop_codon:yes gene_type:complete